MSTSRTIKVLIVFSFALMAVKMPFELIKGIVLIVKPVYMTAEFMLDILISEAFGTDPRTTQIIVFYLMMGFGALIAYALLVYIYELCIKAKTEIPAWCTAQTTQLKTAWHASPLIKKSKVLFGVAVGGTFAAIVALN